MNSDNEFSSTSSSSEDIVCYTESSAYFDTAIGHIEEIILSEKFVKLRLEFLENNWHIFENTEENKLEYMDVFQEYVGTFENLINGELRKRMNQFDIERFAVELNKNISCQDALINNGEILELLHSFNDFVTFKDMMLDYKHKKQGLTKHMDLNILITKSIQPAKTETETAIEVATAKLTETKIENAVAKDASSTKYDADVINAVVRENNAEKCENFV